MMEVTVAQSTGDIAAAPVLGNVSFWSDRLFRKKALEAGLLQPAGGAASPAGRGRYAAWQLHSHGDQGAGLLL
jgi:hypothetical protein